MCPSTWVQCPQNPEEGVHSHGAWVTGGRKFLDMGSRNWIQVFCKSSKCSSCLSHLSSPSLCLFRLLFKKKPNNLLPKKTEAKQTSLSLPVLLPFPDLPPPSPNSLLSAQVILWLERVIFLKHVIRMWLGKSVCVCVAKRWIIFKRPFSVHSKQRKNVCAPCFRPCNNYLNISPCVGGWPEENTLNRQKSFSLGIWDCRGVLRCNCYVSETSQEMSCVAW